MIILEFWVDYIQDKDIDDDVKLIDRHLELNAILWEDTANGGLNPPRIKKAVDGITDTPILSTSLNRNTKWFQMVLDDNTPQIFINRIMSRFGLEPDNCRVYTSSDKVTAPPEYRKGEHWLDKNLKGVESR